MQIKVNCKFDHSKHLQQNNNKLYLLFKEDFFRGI